MREAEVEACLKRVVEMNGGRAHKLYIFNGRGFPDRTCVFPGGKLLFVECKQPQGKRSAAQVFIMRQLQNLGFTCGTIWDCDEAYQIVNTFLSGEELPAWFFDLKQRRPTK